MRWTRSNWFAVVMVAYVWLSVVVFWTLSASYSGDVSHVRRCLRITNDSVALRCVASEIGR